MSKLSTVVALVLFVLSGAIGLRNVVTATVPTISASNSFSTSIWTNGPGPIPRIDVGHQVSNGTGPIPRISTNGPGPIPRVGDSHQRSNGPGPIPRIWTR